MNVQTVELLFVNSGLQKILADMLAAVLVPNDGVLENMHLGLYTAIAGAPPNMVIGDLTEATYAGYARQPLVFGSPGVDEDGRPSVHAASLLFSPTGAATPNTILGAFVADQLAAPGVLRGIAPFDESVQLNDTPNDMSVVCVVRIPIAVNYGHISAIN